MLERLLRFLARVFVEFGLVLLLAGGLLIYLAFRTARRLVLEEEDRLEGISRPLVHLLRDVIELAGALKTDA